MNTEQENSVSYEIQWFIHNGWFTLEEWDTESGAISSLENYRMEYRATAFRVIKKEMLDW